MLKNSVRTVNELLSISVQLVSESIRIIFDVQNSKDLQASWKGKNDPLTIADIKSQTLLIQGLNHHFPEIKIVAEEDQVYPEPLGVDFSSQNAQILPSSLLPTDLTIDTSELTAFIDPLDGTLSYVNGDLQYVTVLLGFALNKRPIIGVIGQIWSLDPDGKIQYDPKVYFGYEPLLSVWSVDGRPDVLLKSIITLPKPPKKDLSNDFTVIYSKNKTHELLEKNIEKFRPTKVIKAGATGYKFMAVVKGIADCYFYEIEDNGTKRWDTCAGEALVSCSGGVTTGKDGVKYDYVWGLDPRNLKGVVSVIESGKHEEVVKITSNLKYDADLIKL